jgi:transaldolase
MGVTSNPSIFEKAIAGSADYDEAIQLKQICSLRIDLDAVTQTLQDDGVASFAQSFESLMASVAAKRAQLLAKRGKHEC